MMLKKVLALAFAACMSVGSIASAVDLIYMGELTKIPYNLTERRSIPKTHDYYFDGDSIEVNTYGDYVDVSIVHTTDDAKYARTDMMSFQRFRIFFKDTPEKSWAGYIHSGDYYKSTEQYIVKTNYLNRDGTINNSAVEGFGLARGESYLGPAFYKDFGFFLKKPNHDGSPYQTPKDRGLKWIKSTADIGVFYDPLDVKVDAKKNTVSAKVVFWMPGINRIEEIKGKFDYTKEQFKPSSAKFYRISTGELTESHKQGLVPGLVGEALRTFKFGSEESVVIAAEFFKQKLSK